MNDRTLLELAARAAGYKLSWSYDNHCCWINEMRHNFDVTWNPLTDDGDALRLSCLLRVSVTHRVEEVRVANRHISAIYESVESDRPAATRRAIVRAAAEIGKSMTQPGATSSP
ncbi:hypothetical protein ABZQ86_26125 [Pseudomonas aeruginosa]